MTVNRDPGRVWVFNAESLQRALDAYTDEALAAYPHQEERIRTVAAAMLDFLNSEHADCLTLDKGRNQSRT